MKSWLEIACFAGFDWARDHHDVVIVDRQGKIVEQFRFEHSQEGWEQWRKKTASFAPLAVAIETSFGAAVDQILRGEAAVYPVNPKSAQHLQGIAGTAPVSYQSGQIDKVHIRHQCDKFLRHAMHLWSDCSRKKCLWARVSYGKKREEGKSHACALRCLGQRWLKIIWKMLQTHAPYDPELHAKNQKLHGSWVLSLQIKTAR